MKLYFREFFFRKKWENIAPKNGFVTIAIPSRYRFSCVSRYNEGNDETGINSRDVTLVICDIFDMTNATFFEEGGGSVYGYWGQKDTNSVRGNLE